MLYYRMFHIAKFYPDMVKHLDAADLSRAGLPDRGRLLDRADGGGEVVRERGRDDERGVHPGVDRHAGAGGQAGVGRHAARPLGEQGRAVRHEDAEPVWVGVRVRLHRLRVHRRVREVRGDAGRRVVPRHACRPMRRDVPGLPAPAQHDRSRLDRTDLLPARHRLPRHHVVSSQLHVADGRLVDPRSRAALRGRSDRLPAPRLRLLAQLVGAGQFRHRGERLRLLVPVEEQRRRDRAADSCPSRAAGPGSASRWRAARGTTAPRRTWATAGASARNATIVTRDPVFGEFAYGGC